ncbi:MAG: substrate-binding domain-containing protein [Myxococcota bacterium]
MAVAGPPPSANTAWLIVAAAVATMLVAGAAVVLGGDQGEQPPFLTQPGPARAAPAGPRDPDAPLGLAGSGSNLPITRALVAAFADGGGRLPVVHPSIGSGGGIRALLDGVVDVALVSRPLKERERALGLVAVPYARVPVIVAVHSDVPDRDITTPQLVAVFAGHHGTWSDGSRITVLQRERGDSSHRAVATAIAGFAETNDEAYREGRWRVLYHDDAMTDALDSTPGALGLFGQGSVPATRSIRALTVDGVPPTVASIREQRYPFTKDLGFVMAGEPTGAVAAFIDFARSPAGRAVVEKAGGMALAFEGAKSEHGSLEDP